MGRLSWRQALWALVVFNALAPSQGSANIGCLFSAALCIDGSEWCYDDYAFGKCMPLKTTKTDAEDSVPYKYDMNAKQLQWFEGELQRLASGGYRWEHSYTQCLLQAMLYGVRHNVKPEDFEASLCEFFTDKIFTTKTMDSIRAHKQREAEENAYVRFIPNSAITDSDYANEVYSPPFPSDDDPTSYMIRKDRPEIEGESPNDKIRNLMLVSGVDGSLAVAPFEGFRERLQAEQEAKELDGKYINLSDKEKKSLPDANREGQAANYADEERLGAHFRKLKVKPYPYTAEYLTSHYSPLDAEVHSNALEKYKQSFAEKNFPFEYENPGEFQEPRIYTDNEDLDEKPTDTGSGKYLHYNSKGTNHPGFDEKNPKNMEYILNYWRKIKNHKPVEAIYAEGGPLKPDDIEGESSKLYLSEELQDLFDREWGFKRRERDDVKKPGPRLDAKILKILYHNKSVTANGKSPDQTSGRKGHDHSNFNHDPAYAYVLFKNRFLTDWEKGLAFISRLEELLGLEKNTFTNPRVDTSEVTFKVEKNSKGYDAEDVARHVVEISEEIRRETGAQILSTGVGDKSKLPIISQANDTGSQYFDYELPILLTMVGSFIIVLVGAVIFAVLLKKDMDAKAKMSGLASAADIDAEATRDYQLCRARMSGKWTGQQAAPPPQPAEPPQRITSLSREPEGNSPSTRSSTSSWSEEPALTNMDISTGHMVLAYMEDHLRNKDRLEQEWRALCAYEAEPCATVAALKAENTGKNRYADVLPYDHSRVTLNTLTNHLGSDYINASTITDHDPRNPAYIAAAGPLAHTAPDFWQMVWEQGSVVMVMLTRLTENGQQLCHRYWPEEGSELYHIYEVHLVSEHIWCDDYLVRSFYLKNQRTGETRTVTQFHFLSWPDNGVPSSTKALLEFRRKVNKSYRGRSCPIVVHCSDGAGRTGTYCLIDMVLNRMAKGAKEIDIAATLEHIRDQRLRTVATKQQFEFVLMAVAEEVHAILKALPAHLQQLQEKKDKEKEKDKDGNEKEKPN
ncbi:receptor-type tyrosine-protein phosphatase N2 isoform X2 [Battus philenor]|uniref:receptor-type tyrosine-protein phosphatase N2 isoform X2 n=1 Tax=Battus philenor TaxID=42288 RepID=UPI0035CFA010